MALGDAREALKLVEEGARFDVVFCDLMMPNLRGDVLYDRVKAIAPGLAETVRLHHGGGHRRDSANLPRSGAERTSGEALRCAKFARHRTPLR